MRIHSIAVNLARWALVPVLAATVGLTTAQAKDHGNGHGDQGNHGRGNGHYDRGDHGNRGRGNGHYDRGDQGNRGRGHAYGRDRGYQDYDRVNYGHGHYDHGRGHAYGRERRGEDFHFHGDDRDHFARYYDRDVDYWRRYPRWRPRFYRGYYIPRTYVIQVVPPAYYVGMPPPPPGCNYGYYDGYVVAYNPTTRMIADAIDLVGTAIATR